MIYHQASIIMKCSLQVQRDEPRSISVSSHICSKKPGNSTTMIHQKKIIKQMVMICIPAPRDSISYSEGASSFTG